MRSSERASGAQLSSTWKSRSRPFAVAASNTRSSAASSFAPGASPRNVSPPSTPPWRVDRLDDGAELRLVVDRELDREQRDRLQRDAALPCLAHLREHRPRDRRSACRCESIWVRIAPVPCAKAQRSAKSMRARTSSADQRVSRSAITASCARPGRCRRGSGCAARCGPCRDGCARRRSAAARCRRRDRRGPIAGGRRSAPERSRRCAPSSITMSQGARPSAPGLCRASPRDRPARAH